MPRDFELVSMTDLRAKPGEILDAVSDRGRAFLVERKGIPLACLVPVEDFMPDIPKARLAQEFSDVQKVEADHQISLNARNEVVIRVPGLAGEPDSRIEIVLPHGYPSVPPIIRADPVDDSSPHRWPDGSLCLYGMMTQWNPGKHGATSSINLARIWLRGYRSWRQTGAWPQPDETNEPDNTVR